MFLEVCSSTFSFRKFQMCRRVPRATQWTLVLTPLSFCCKSEAKFIHGCDACFQNALPQASYEYMGHGFLLILSKSPSTDTEHVGTYGPFSKSLQMPPKVFCCYSSAGFISLCSVGTVLEVFVVILINQNLRVSVPKKVTQFEFI